MNMRFILLIYLSWSCSCNYKPRNTQLSVNNIRNLELGQSKSEVKAIFGVPSDSGYLYYRYNDRRQCGKFAFLNIEFDSTGSVRYVFAKSKEFGFDGYGLYGLYIDSLGDTLKFEGRDFENFFH